MAQITFFPGRYIQGEGAINALGKEISKFGKKGFIICTSHAFKNIFPGMKGEMEKSVEITAERFGGECSDDEISRLTLKARDSKSDTVIGIGGGNIGAQWWR